MPLPRVAVLTGQEKKRASLALVTVLRTRMHEHASLLSSAMDLARLLRETIQFDSFGITGLCTTNGSKSESNEVQGA